MNKTTPLALATLSAVALVGGAAITGSTAQADDGASPAPATPAKKAVVSTCTGGASANLFSRTMNFQNIAAGSTAEVEGSQWQVKGPKKGSDTVLLTFTALANSGGPGEALTAQLYRNGVGTTEGTKYVTYNGIYDQAAVSFCTKIKKGNHTFSLRVTDNGGNASSLNYPTVTYQRFR